MSNFIKIFLDGPEPGFLCPYNYCHLLLFILFKEHKNITTTFFYSHFPVPYDHIWSSIYDHIWAWGTGDCESKNVLVIFLCSVKNINNNR